MARIYLASSWRNRDQSDAVRYLRDEGHSVYDFKSDLPIMAGGPVPTAFAWSDLDTNWQDWSPDEYRRILLNNQRAAHGFLGDSRGMEWADTCVLLMPCGRSAHIEAGYMKGRGKRLIIFYPYNTRDQFEPELMYLFADHIAIGWNELMDALKN